MPVNNEDAHFSMELNHYEMKLRSQSLSFS